MCLGEVSQRRQGLGGVPSLQVRNSEIVSNVIAQVPRMDFRTAERVDGLGIILIQHVRVAEHQPSQCSGVFFGMGTGVGLDSGIGWQRAILEELLRHGPQTRRRHEGLAHSPDSRRNCVRFSRVGVVTRGAARCRLAAGGRFMGRRLTGSALLVAAGDILTGLRRGRSFLVLRRIRQKW